MRVATSAVLLALLTACVPRVYAPPAGDLGSYAKVTLGNASPAPLTARLYEDALACSGMVNLFEKNRPVATNETVSVYARKGEPFTVGAVYVFSFGTGWRHCDLNTTFVPTAASYHVVFSSDAQAQQCAVVPVEGDGKAARPLPKEKFVVRKSSTPFLQTGSWCRGLTDEQRAVLGVPATTPTATPAPTSTTSAAGEAAEP